MRSFSTLPFAFFSVKIHGSGSREHVLSVDRRKNYGFALMRASVFTFLSIGSSSTWLHSTGRGVYSNSDRSTAWERPSILPAGRISRARGTPSPSSFSICVCLYGKSGFALCDNNPILTSLPLKFSLRRTTIDNTFGEKHHDAYLSSPRFLRFFA